MSHNVKHASTIYALVLMNMAFFVPQASYCLLPLKSSVALCYDYTNSIATEYLLNSYLTPNQWFPAKYSRQKRIACMLLWGLAAISQT